VGCGDREVEYMPDLVTDHSVYTMDWSVDHLARQPDMTVIRGTGEGHGVTTSVLEVRVGTDVPGELDVTRGQAERLLGL
jgi:hypothetical protein